MDYVRVLKKKDIWDKEKQLNENIVKDIHAFLTENMMIGGIYRNQEVRMSGAGHTPPVGNGMYLHKKFLCRFGEKKKRTKSS